jgi:hypothetical protein
MCYLSSPSGCKPSDVAPEFIKQIEDELSRRLGQRVGLVLGHGIAAVRANRGFPAGVSTVVMDMGPLLRRRQAVEWADAFEQKISRVCARVQDVEHLVADIEKSPTPEKTGAIVLEHLEDYDDEFFEALADVIIREKADLHLDRVHHFEALREYLRMVRRRAMADETADMWRELAQGAARDRDLAS